MKILIVDDEKNIRNSLAKYLQLEKIQTATASNGLSAKKLLEEEVFDAAVIDLKMPNINGLELLKWIQEQGPLIPVIMISAYGEINDAVDAMKHGAKDYIVKPFNPEELLLRLERVINEKKINDQIKTGKQILTSDDYFIGNTKEIIKIKNIISKVANTSSTILITGESGTGKEVVAKSIHKFSERAKNPFVSINIGAIPDTLLESELFGHEKGAFTGAVEKKIGLFELASSGTLFLDEIGDMPLLLQVKLLRVLQEKKIQRLGGTQSIPIDVRIIAATNKNIEQIVKEKIFREDLYFRLNVIRINLPPLRERTDDIPTLVGFFIEKLNKSIPKRIKNLSNETINILKNYDFPGNIRELENILERAFILTEEEIITPKDLGLNIPENNKDLKNKKYKNIEKQAIIEALQRWEGNRTKAAQELGISRRSIIYKIKEYEIDK
ncbi:MAG: sigma-54-dependent Fis family transcriptional regulator [Spirochaetes bacterium]|nr:sigma-54-dependent Fis family transcriptional regulator [Spirochaetota bacterium]